MQKEVILFLDGAHPDHQTQATYGWMKKGSKLAIKTTAKQLRLHYMGVINVANDKITHITKSYEKINSNSIADFLGEIQQKLQHQDKIHIILDNASYHKNKEVKAFLQQPNNKLQLHYLPPYSPNLNLIERLWKIMRQQVTYNQYYSTFDEFQHNIKTFFQNLDQIQHILLQRITDKFQVIDPRFVRV